MIDDFLRDVKDRTLLPLARSVAGSLSANQLSLLALAAGLLCAASLATRRSEGLPNWIAVALWTLNRTLDGLDGPVARLTRTESSFGGLLDISCDLVAYATVPIGIVEGNRSMQRAEETILELYATAFMLASFYVNIGVLLMLGGLVEQKGAAAASGSKKPARKTALHLPSGMIEGAETVAAYYAFLLFPRHIRWSYPAFAVLVIATTLQRLVWAWRNV